MHPERQRYRSAVTFEASAYWKGTPAKEVTLHVVEPGTDCIGARFIEGKEYVVFAVSQEADDHNLGDDFW